MTNLGLNEATQQNSIYLIKKTKLFINDIEQTLSMMFHSMSLWWKRNKSLNGAQEMNQIGTIHSQISWIRNGECQDCTPRNKVLHQLQKKTQHILLLLSCCYLLWLMWCLAHFWGWNIFVVIQDWIQSLENMLTLGTFAPVLTVVN
jgi:hypothetical protein